MDPPHTASASDSTSVELTLKRKSNDIGWTYCNLVDPSNLDKVQCIKCGKKMSGGIYRLKAHIAGIRGNVASCTKASKEERELCKNAINEAKLKKKQKMDEDRELRLGVNIINDGREDTIDKKTNYEIKASMTCFSSKEQMLQKNTFVDGLMMQVYEISDPFLKKEVDRTKSLLKSHEEEWKEKGCSIMTDGCSDRKRRIIMNLCVNSRLGTVFLSSKEFSDVSHTNEVIFEYVDQCIEEVGPDNVVQIVTDNAANNMGAAKLLKEKRSTIFWTSCGAHTIDLMLESIAKQERFKKVTDQAKSITIFLYAHHQVLSMMRAFTKKDIVRPGVTRFASAFLTLQSLNDSGTELKVFTPLIKVLRIADGDTKPSMGFLYGELIQAKEDIKISLSNLPKNYEPIIEVIDGRIKGRLDSSLHLTAYLLNPFYHYNNPLIQLHKDVVLGMMDCIDVMYPGDISVQDKILNEEFPIYREKRLIFGKPLVVKACSFNDAKFDPVSWWLTLGIITPTLQRLTVRILSLTTSSSGCERNWSAFEGDGDCETIRDLYDDDFESEEDEEIDLVNEVGDE
ncbi:hypothetical protein C2S53_015076 [Perilla frutescens var. hirtella]|uniref:BED-type domain-containing protein n=1 Tax=Perilla frutescens var. hirtella TaxID=608512 RepID=A0AAD4PA34_PERFH|nr:hypothetical protein C2S53_015076 [Perilla frutescens var. hirtella]